MTIFLWTKIQEHNLNRFIIVFLFGASQPTLKVLIFACTNFRERNFRENLFSRISRIWQKNREFRKNSLSRNFRKFAFSRNSRKFVFAKFSKNTKFAKFKTKTSLIWKTNNSCMHQCIKETFLQGVYYRLGLWRLI